MGQPGSTAEAIPSHLTMLCSVTTPPVPLYFCHFSIPSILSLTSASDEPENQLLKLLLPVRWDPLQPQT